MSDVQRRELNELRRAINGREAEQAQYFLKRLLMALPYFHGLAVALGPVQRFLPQFEQMYPEEAWVRRLLVLIASFGAAPDENPAEAALMQSGFDQPGAMNFLKAIYDITQAMSDAHAATCFRRSGDVAFMGGQAVSIYASASRHPV